LYIKDRRFTAAMKLFDPEAVKKLGAVLTLPKDAAREREQVSVLCGLGKGVVLAYQDRAEESNAEFRKVVEAYPPPLNKKDPLVPPKKADIRPVNRGLLDQFFARSVAGANWKRAVGEALDRNEQNLGGQL